MPEGVETAMEKALCTLVLSSVGAKAWMFVPPHNLRWSAMLARRQIQDYTVCTSYSVLQSELRDAVSCEMAKSSRRIFNGGEVEGTVLFKESSKICSEIASEARQLTEEHNSSCSFISSIMNSFSGLCTESGTVSDFYNSVFSGFKSVTISMQNGDECRAALSPLLDECPRVYISLDTAILKGPEEYQRMMKARMKCMIEEMDKKFSELHVCGDIASLRRLVMIFELLTRIAPGVTFTMDDFDLC